ncbi:MAG: PKD domain-containing protein [Candidatus Bathyarchaeia archaeon]|nr:PKD domain-containing protein [Candidatus Bathyarchaeia archaeon]
MGQSVSLTGSVSGGASPYTYQWCVNGTAISGATSSSWTFTPTSSGTYEIYLNVTDADGYTAKSGTVNHKRLTSPRSNIRRCMDNNSSAYCSSRRRCSYCNTSNDQEKNAFSQQRITIFQLLFFIITLNFRKYSSHRSYHAKYLIAFHSVYSHKGR